MSKADKRIPVPVTEDTWQELSEMKQAGETYDNENSLSKIYEPPSSVRRTQRVFPVSDKAECTVKENLEKLDKNPHSRGVKRQREASCRWTCDVSTTYLGTTTKYVSGRYYLPMTHVKIRRVTLTQSCFSVSSTSIGELSDYLSR